MGERGQSGRRIEKYAMPRYDNLRNRNSEPETTQFIYRFFIDMP
jgi:hypothetical protein